MSNCLFFALNKWLKHGGYLVIRKSRYGFWPHFIWCKDLKNAEIEHYVPTVSRLKLEQLHKFVFKGMIKFDDIPHDIENLSE